MWAEISCTLPARTPHAVVFTELHRFAVFALVLLAQMLAGRSATTCNALAAHAIVLAYLGTSTGLALVLLPTVLADGFASTFFAPASHAVSGSGTKMCTRSSRCCRLEGLTCKRHTCTCAGHARTFDFHRIPNTGSCGAREHRRPCPRSLCICT